MTDFQAWVMFTLALWIITHVITEQNPWTEGRGKPFECQLCTSGWTCIILFAVAVAMCPENWDRAGLFMFGGWGGAVLINGLYHRMQMMII